VRKLGDAVPARRALEFIAAATAHLDGVRAEAFDTLVVEFARSIGATAIVKGLRAISDFEYELEMKPAQPPAGAGDRIGLHHGEPGVQLRLLQRVKELADLRRPDRGPRAPRCGAALAGRTVPNAKIVTERAPHRPARYPVAMDVLVLIDNSTTWCTTQAGSADRSGARRQGGDLRSARPDARHDPRDQAGALDRQGAPGDAGGGQARGRADRQGGAGAPGTPDLQRGGHEAASAPPRTSSRRPRRASARSPGPRITPTRFSTPWRSTFRSSSPPWQRRGREPLLPAAGIRRLPSARPPTLSARGRRFAFTACWSPAARGTAWIRP